MIRKNGYRFSEKLMLKQELKRNVPTEKHFALGGAARAGNAHWILQDPHAMCG